MKSRLFIHTLFTLLFSLVASQNAASQRHVTFKGICVNGKVDKIKSEFQKMGITHFQQYRGFYNSISTISEIPPNYSLTTIQISFSAKTQTVSSLLFVIRDENRDSIYNEIHNELATIYNNSYSYTDGTSYFQIKNKINKDIGLILLKKMKYKNNLALLVVDYKNHYKAIREGGSYLEEFLLGLELIMQSPST